MCEIGIKIAIAVSGDKEESIKLLNKCKTKITKVFRVAKVEELPPKDIEGSNTTVSSLITVKHTNKTKPNENVMQDLSMLYTIIERDISIRKEDILNKRSKKGVIGRRIIGFILKHKHNVSYAQSNKLFGIASRSSYRYKNFNIKGINKKLYTDGNLLLAYKDAKKRA